MTAAVLQSVTIAVTRVNRGRTDGAFTANGHYNNGTTQTLTTEVAWTSSVPATATINVSSGLATGVAAETMSITAASGGFISSGVTLTVTPATLQSIAVTLAMSRIAAGLTQPYTATGTYSNG